MDLSETFSDLLTKYRLQIVQRLQMDRTFLFDYLVSKSSFDKTDCELIKAEKTSEQKAGKFLDILETKGEGAFDHFIDALQITNPALFEMLTGKKPDKDLGDNPAWKAVQSHIFCGEGSLYLDLDILTNYCKRMSVDLQDMTLRYDQVLKDNTDLRKKLKDALEDEARKQNKIDTLQRQVLDTEDALANEACSNASKVGANLLEKFEIVDREEKTSKFIIQLQMKLLKAHDENDNYKGQIEELKDQNDGLLQQLSKVNENYAFERKETTKLCEKLKSQSEEVKSCETLKSRVRELQFQIGKMRSEMQEKENDLTEMKRWTEALKTRFDLVVDEREKMLKNRKDVEGECRQQREENCNLRLKLGYKEREVEESKRSYLDIEDSLKICREEREYYCNALKNQALELEEIRREKQEVTQRYNKALDAKETLETNLRHHIEYRHQLESKYEEIKGELASMKSLLNQENEDKEQLRENVLKLEAKLQQQTEDSHPKEQQSEDENVSQTQDFREAASRAGTSKRFVDWKERAAKELVCSIQRRLATNQQRSRQQRAKAQGMRKSRSFDEQLANLIPEFEELPSDLKKSFSLDKHLMKQIWPYEALATLLPCAGPSLHDVLDAVASPFSGRKMSAPTLDFFAFGRQEHNETEIDEDSDEDEDYNKVPEHSLKNTPKTGGFRPRTRAVVRKRNRCLTEPTIPISKNFFS